jgi:hypothetical protein
MRTSWSDRLLLAEATATLGAASMAVRLLPFRRLVSGRADGAPGGSAGSVDTRRLVWAVRAAARRSPWRAVCIEQALCLRTMLRRRGVRCELHYGIAREVTGAPKAHVWLSVDGDTVIGGEAADGYTRVATFPG